MRLRLGLAATVALAVLVVDQLTKWWAVAELSDRDVDVVWTLRFHLVRNFGASFSLVPGRGEIVGFVSLGAVVFLFWLAARPQQRAAVVAFGLLIGGALGNVVDRLFRADGDGVMSGGVIDFIDFQWWPVFNIADVVVFAGIALLFLAGPQEVATDDRP